MGSKIDQYWSRSTILDIAVERSKGARGAGVELVLERPSAHVASQFFRGYLLYSLRGICHDEIKVHHWEYHDTLPFSPLSGEINGEIIWTILPEWGPLIG
jgi:hypothetical protein